MSDYLTQSVYQFWLFKKHIGVIFRYCIDNLNKNNKHISFCHSVENFEATMSEVKENIESQNRPLKQFFPCDSCDRKYSSKSTLISHVKSTHEDIKKYHLPFIIFIVIVICRDIIMSQRMY